MLKIFLYPLWYIGAILLVGGLSVGSDIMTLTNVNILSLIKSSSPQSYIYILVFLILMYFSIVIIQLLLYGGYKDSGSHRFEKTNSSNNTLQKIKVRDVNNSTIIQSRRDHQSEENKRNNKEI